VTQELKVMKVKEADGSKCFILILNRSDNALPEAVLNATAPAVSFSPRGFLFLCISCTFCNDRVQMLMEPHLTSTGCHLPYGITQCYLPPDTSEHIHLNPIHTGRYSIYLPWMDGRLSWPRWLVTYRDGLLARRRSPIQVLTRSSVD